MFHQARSTNTSCFSNLYGHHNGFGNIRRLFQEGYILFTIILSMRLIYFKILLIVFHFLTRILRFPLSVSFHQFSVFIFYSSSTKSMSKTVLLFSSLNNKFANLSTCVSSVLLYNLKYLFKMNITYFYWHFGLWLQVQKFSSTNIC